MHDNDGQVTPVSQAFSVLELEDLSARTSELEALLEILSAYGEFQGETGNAISAVTRLTHHLQDAIIKAISQYKRTPGTIGYTGKPISGGAA